ncbi:HAD family hydrolase [Staphylococcus pseudoxylosus]|uniref:HAD family hydrolase n=1 Tax=Staphylococcus pseudoxylosus TaxID=2282419 RepID=UPI002DB979D3|nr:HAD family hydrolase [Staphylococcus pseudoxylosus]MEB6045023.1 HAD family hydrolase [Staphylococcus pseudoxylosus]MEB8007902.1 HAD family hydrolase [Staphylococcus pseudoxylosus]
MNNGVELILFDLDNTLYPFDEYWTKANEEVFKDFEYTKNLDYQEFNRMLIYYDEYYWKQHDSGQITLDQLRYLRLIKALETFNVHISYEEAREYFATFFNYILSYITPDYELIELLKILKKYKKIGILTNGKIREQREKISRLNFGKVFDKKIYISEEINIEKPDIKSFQYVANAFNVSVENTLFIGDSLHNDVLGSLSAGMKPIWLTTEKHLDDYRIDNIEIYNHDIKSLVMKLIEDCK